MSRSTRTSVVALWVLAASIMVLPSAQAYVDAGSTAVMFQALVAGIAAAGTGIALFRDKIRAKFTSRRRDANEDA